MANALNPRNTVQCENVLVLDHVGFLAGNDKNSYLIERNMPQTG